MAPSQLKSLFGTMRRKPAKTPDGLTDKEAGGGVQEKTSLIHDLTHLNLKNARTVVQAITTLASGEPMNDKGIVFSLRRYYSGPQV